MTITTAQATSLLENVLFESSTLATANAAGWIAQNQQAAGSLYSAANTMAQSAESGIAQQVIRYYQAALDRAPAAFEIQYYVAIAEQGLSAAQIAQGASAVPQSTWNVIAQDFVNSPEAFLPASPEWANYNVYALYQNILNRNPSYEEFNYYYGQLNRTNPSPIAAVMQEFANSPEYQQNAGSAILAGLANSGISALTGGNPVSAMPGTGIVTIVPSATSVTEGSMVIFKIAAGLPDGTVIEYKLDGIAASALISTAGVTSNLSGSVTVSGGSASLTFLLTSLENQGFSGSFTLSLSLPDYGGAAPLQQVTLPLIETKTQELNGDPPQDLPITGVSGDINELLINYANPAVSAYGRVTGFQVLGLGNSAAGTFNVAALVGAGAPIEVIGPLSAGGVVLVNTAANQTLTFDYATGAHGNGVTLQMSAAAASSASHTLTVELAPDSSTSTPTPLDTLTLGGTLTAGDVVNLTIGGYTIHQTVSQGDTVSEVLNELVRQEQSLYGANSPVAGAGSNSITVKGYAGTLTPSDSLTVSGSGTETAAIDHTISANSLTAPGYATLTLDTGLLVKTTALLVSDTALTHLVVTGAANLLLSAPDAQLASIDTSAYTGSLTLTGGFAADGVSVNAGQAKVSIYDATLDSGATLSFTATGGGDTVGADKSTTAAAGGKALINIAGGNNEIDLAACDGGATVAVGGTGNFVSLGAGNNLLTLAGLGGNTVVLQATDANSDHTAIAGAHSGDSLEIIYFPAGAVQEWAGGGVAAAQIKSGAAFADYLAAATGFTDGTKRVFSWFEYGGNTYIVENAVSNATTQTVSHGMAELIGTYDLAAHGSSLTSFYVTL